MKKITLLMALLMVSVGFGQTVLEDFEGTAPTVTGTSTLVASISSDVAKDTKSLKIITEASGDAWQSANLILQGDIVDLRTTKTVTADVYATTAFKMLCKVVQGEPASATSAAHTGSGWETLTFDFSNPEDGTSEANDAYGEIQFFTNWDGTGSGTNTTNANWNNSIAGTFYVDNISGVGFTPLVDTPPTVAPAVPTELASDVISVYSDSYATIATNIDPDWGQATVVSEIDFAGNKVMKYANLNYQGLEYTSTDVSAKGYLHLDYYTTDATAFQLFLIAGTEQFYDVAATDDITTGQWVSLDIPLSFFADKGSDLTVARQFKTVGNNNLYLDNLYFYGAAPTVLEDFEGTAPTVTGTSTLVASISSDVAKDTKSLKIITEASGDAWQSANLILQGDIVDLRTTKTVTADVYATTAFKMLCKVVQGEPASATSAAHTGSGWETLTFDFSNPEDGTSEANDAYGEIQFFTNWDGTGSGTNTTNANWNNSIAGTFYVDNISGVGFTPLVDTPPTVAPAVPTELASDVISVYSDSYATIATNIDPDWGQATVVSEIDFAGNKVMKYANLNYQGLEYTSTDVSAKGYLHLDYYTTDATAFQLFLIAGTEQFYDVAATDDITTGQWVSLDIPLSFFADKGSDLTVARQFKTVGNNNLYLDNLYFYGAAAPIVAPTVAAPSPPVRNAADVVSIYSDAYDAISPINYDEAWCGPSAVTATTADGDNVFAYNGNPCQGIGFAGDIQDVTGLTNMHVDLFIAEGTDLVGKVFNVKIVYSAGGETSFNIDINALSTAPIPGTWYSYDALVSITGSNIQQVGITSNLNNVVWYDNLYFWKEAVDPATDTTLSDLTVDGTTVTGFEADKLTYDIILSKGTTVVPTLVGTPTQLSPATAVTTAATELPGTSTVLVTAQDGTTTETYTVNFTVDTNTECTGFSSEAQQGTFSADYSYGFETLTNGDVRLTFAMSSGTAGIVAYAWKEAPFAETPMNVSGTEATLDISGYTTGASISYAVKFAWAAGGFGVTKYFSYTVGEDCATASIDKNNLLGISLYPNPAKGSLNISAKNTIESATIYNVLGKKVKSFTVNANTSSLDVSGLSRGIYILKYTANNAVGSMKFVKE